MLRRYTFWLSAAVIFMLLTAAFHAISLFVKLEPANETERQLIELVTTYRMDAGAGFHPSFGNLMTALSSCFSFLCLLGGLTLGYLMIKHTEMCIRDSSRRARGRSRAFFIAAKRSRFSTRNG